LSQLPDPTDPSKVVQTALGGIREALKAGRDIKETAKEVNAFLDEEAKARVAWRRRQQEVQRRGDMMYIDAINEYRLLADIRMQKDRAFKVIEKEFGKRAIQEVRDLEERLRRDKRDLDKAYNSDRQHTRNEWLVIILCSAVIYAVLKLTKVW
jgi:hypothetical protein